ncbi:MAG: transporter permease [Sphingomonas sp.]|nr:transporter permease [Sphingomonas sp.]
MRRAEALGILAAAVLVGILTTGFYFGFVYWAQGVPRAGNMPGLLLAIPPFAVAVAGLGMVLGSLFRAGDDALKPASCGGCGA